MKKLLVVAVLVAAGGWLAYAKVLRPAPKRACDRLAQLCGDSGRGKWLPRGISEVREVAVRCAVCYLRAGGGTAISCA